jgi:hypothetical protein
VPGPNRACGPGRGDRSPRSPRLPVGKRPGTASPEARDGLAGPVLCRLGQDNGTTHGSGRWGASRCRRTRRDRRCPEHRRRGEQHRGSPSRQRPVDARDRRQLLGHAARLPICTAPDHATGRVGRRCVVAHQRQARGVQHAQVPGLVHRAHRHLGRHPVEVVTVGMLAQQGVVVAEPEDPAGQVDVRAGGHLAELLDDVVDAVHGPVRWGQQDRPHGQDAQVGDMGVRIDQTRHQRPAGQVDHLGGRSSGRSATEFAGARSPVDSEVPSASTLWRMPARVGSIAPGTPDSGAMPTIVTES